MSPRSRSHHHQGNSLCYSFALLHALGLDPCGLLRAHSPRLKSQQCLLALRMHWLQTACARRPADLSHHPYTLVLCPQGIRDAHRKSCRVLCFMLQSRLCQRWACGWHSSCLSGISDVLGQQTPPEEDCCLSSPSHTPFLSWKRSKARLPI